MKRRIMGVAALMLAVSIVITAFYGCDGMFGENETTGASGWHFSDEKESSSALEQGSTEPETTAAATTKPTTAKATTTKPKPTTTLAPDESSSAVVTTKAPVTVKPNTSGIVVDAVNYTRALDFTQPPYDKYAHYLTDPEYIALNAGYKNSNDYMHVIKIPKINSETENAQAFNQKMYSCVSSNYQMVLNNSDFSMVWIEYEYMNYNGIVAINIDNGGSDFDSGSWNDANLFYYDTKKDKELTLAEYLKALGLSEKNVLKWAKTTKTVKKYSGNVGGIRGCMSDGKTIYVYVDVYAKVDFVRLKTTVTKIKEYIASQKTTAPTTTADEASQAAATTQVTA